MAPPVHETPKPPIVSCGQDEKGNWVCKGQNLPGVGSTPDIPIDPRKIPEMIREKLNLGDKGNKGLADCRGFPGFTPGGSSAFKGQCCRGIESKDNCCPPQTIASGEVLQGRRETDEGGSLREGRSSTPGKGATRTRRFPDPDSSRRKRICLTNERGCEEAAQMSYATLTWNRPRDGRRPGLFRRSASGSTTTARSGNPIDAPIQPSGPERPGPTGPSLARTWMRRPPKGTPDVETTKGDRQIQRP